MREAVLVRRAGLMTAICRKRRGARNAHSSSVIGSRTIGSRLGSQTVLGPGHAQPDTRPMRAYRQCGIRTISGP